MFNIKSAKRLLLSVFALAKKVSVELYCLLRRASSLLFTSILYLLADSNAIAKKHVFFIQSSHAREAFCWPRVVQQQHAATALGAASTANQQSVVQGEAAGGAVVPLGWGG